MTATIHHLSTSFTDVPTEVSTVNLSRNAQTSVSFGEGMTASQKIINDLNSTNIDTGEIVAKRVGDATVERTYPHVFDEGAETGQVRNNILNALDNARGALDSYGVPDLESMNTKIIVIATIMSRTHLLTEFNESLGAVVSFLRRAMLNTPIENVNRPALNALVNVLQLMADNPMIDLDDACDLIDKLSNEGWHGMHGIADKLVTLLFEESSTENNTDLQGKLFADVQTEGAQDREF